VEIVNQILEVTGASHVKKVEEVQTLWSGYGQLNRYHLEGGKFSSVIVKHIQLPDSTNHPRGWNTNRSHQRKLKSYNIERNWYQRYTHLTNDNCKVPLSLHIAEAETELLLILEDLNAAGYELRYEPGSVTVELAKNCLAWLAAFHAQFMGDNADGLWEQGTYWHLDTRPDELEKMNNTQLKNAASGIDNKLKAAKHKTIIHGDAKLANFCFSKSDDVSAVDFQYVGKGCGMKDVAYFISSCFDEDDCENLENELLDHYFNILEKELGNTSDYQIIKREWSELYRYAWADLYRFLDGWSPGHWKMHGYSEKLTQQVINELNQQC